MATSDPEEWSDIEGALRTWMRADSDIQAAVGTRVFHGVPRKVTESGSFPMIVLTRIGGGGQASEVPLDNAMMQFDVYGRKADAAGGGKVNTAPVVSALRKSLSKIRGKTLLTGNVYAWDPRVSTVVYSPLPGDDRPRYMVVVLVPNMIVT